LLRVHERFGTGDDADLGLHMSREDLATIVGTATESLIRCLTELKEDALIDTQGRSIRIKNKARLEQLARG
ncbi:MAG TPA: helix-turn-helix domain-containing protein, partial [Flavobacteriales bacterium]|nr:helix-turn-helix domain-containing protein [Flavobacteriales bacterium]